MYVVYNVETGWSLRDQIDIIGDYGLAIARQPYRPFPAEFFDDLEMHQVLLRGTDCLSWSGIIHRNKTPYYYNRYAPGYKQQMPARQLLISRHLNLDPMCFPIRLKVGMLCTTPLCTYIGHMIPYSFYARTKLGDIAVPQSSEVELTPARQAELQDAAKALRARLERDEPLGKPPPPVMDHDKIMDILNYKKTR
jgi:hypothetical protein